MNDNILFDERVSLLPTHRYFALHIPTGEILERNSILLTGMHPEGRYSNGACISLEDGLKYYNSVNPEAWAYAKDRETLERLKNV